MADRSWWNFERFRHPCLILAVVLAVQIPHGLHGQALTPELDKARREPIIDGKGAAGIQLGDAVEAVIQKLGGQPWKIEEFDRGSRRDFLYVGVGPQKQWTLVLSITLRQNHVQAVAILVGRRAPEPYPYQGQTRKGYRPGDSPDRLHMLYGVPDEVINLRPTTQEFWWYRDAGLLITPGERSVQGEMETSLIVLNPQATLAEVRQLLHLQ